MNYLDPLIILVDDETETLSSYSLLLKSAGFKNFMTVNDSRNLMPLLEQYKPSVIALDLHMPYVSGMELLSKIKSDYPDIQAIMITAANDVETAVELMKLGAFDYFLKPIDKTRFIAAINRAIEFQMMQVEMSMLRHYLLTNQLENEKAFSSIITHNKEMIAIFLYIEAIAGSDQPITIIGETGVGKELMAKAVHEVSQRRGEFIAVNVAGLDDTLYSDTLFGHRKGAFSSADSSREGLIAKAAKGSLFLDEIGDLDEASQIKLLRVLQEKKYYPLGSNRHFAPPHPESAYKLT
jgi:DNA-binding NtrC family response regulator